MRRYHDTFPAGDHSFEWDGRNEGGQQVPAGVYFSTFQAGELRQTRKLVLLGGL